MNTSKYFFQSLAVVVVSTLSFLAFKTFLPKKLFSEDIASSKNIVVDSLLLEAIAEDGDLIHTDDKEKADEDGFSIVAMWNWERKNYFIK